MWLEILYQFSDLCLGTDTQSALTQKCLGFWDTDTKPSVKGAICVPVWSELLFGDVVIK